MLFSLSIGPALALAIALTSTASADVFHGAQSVQDFRKAFPYTNPPADKRPKIQIRASKSATDDVSADFLAGLKKANNGGTLVLPKGQTFVIGKKLDLTFLNNVQVNLEGTIQFTNNITYWQKNNFYHPFQTSISFWKWGGKDIKIFGSGTLDGNGQAWYDDFASYSGKANILDKNNTYYRPILFFAENATNLRVEGIRFQASPCWTNFLVGSKNVVYDKVVLENLSQNKNRPKNTDGWDSYNVDGMTVTDSWVNLGDDCFSAKPNTSNLLIENIYCNGTHGISMGSIGQYAGVKDYIYNAHIENVTMLNAQNGARLKVWAGQDAGYGFIQNVTFKNFYNYNVDLPIVLDACYFNIPDATCAKYPSEVDMIDIHFQNFSGSSSGKNGRQVAELICSPNAVCRNITVDGLQVTSPKGSPPTVTCDGIAGGVGAGCVPSKSTLTGN